MHGKYTTYTCPSGLHWNRNSNVCDFPDNAGCEEGAAGEQESPDIEPVIAEFEEWDAVEEVPDPTPASTTKKTTASWEADYEYKPMATTHTSS